MSTSLHLRAYLFCRGLGFGEFDEQRHVNRLVIEKNAVTLFSMRAQALAMVGDDHNPSICVELLRLQCRQQFSNRGVGGGNSGVVCGMGGARIVDVHPEKEGPLRVLY